MAYYSIRQAADYLHTSISTLRRWEDEGKIKPYRTAGNHRRYDKTMLDSVLDGTPVKDPTDKIIIGYCRVSTSDQKDDLIRQKKVVQNYCEKQGRPFKIVTDIGSGLNYKRKGFTRLIHLICQRQCSQIVINYQDRIARFGFELIQEICQENNVKLVILNQTAENDPNQELVQDVLSVITVFSAKLYGRRSHRNARIVNENKRLFSEKR